MKAKVESDNLQILVKCKLDWTEQVAYDEVAVFDKRVIRGLMKPMIKGSRKIEYTVPGGIPLQKFLMDGLNKDRFFMVFAQIVEIVKKVKINNLILDNLYLSLSHTFINEKTDEVYFMYLPVRDNKNKLNIKVFLCDMAYTAVFPLNEDVSFINDLVTFLNEMEGFSVKDMEQYILDKYPAVYERLSRQDYEEPRESVKEELSAPLQPQNISQPKIKDHALQQNNTKLASEKKVASDEKSTHLMEEEEEETTLLIEEEEEETTFLMEEETTVFMEENTITAYLIRVKTCERADVNKPLFHIGKGDKADYIISDNNAISRAHAEISREDQSYYLKDNHSTNGTFVNEKQLSADQLVEILDGDTIMLANERFEFHIEK